MYVIGISPGAYQIAKSFGAESARELAGLEEKLKFGYTVGCNFFQIDQEVFGEFVEPNVFQRVARLISEMNIQWALHGLLIGEIYQTLEPINFLSWKLSHLVLHRDLIYLYQLLREIKRNKYPKEVFPHYTIYHASKEIIVGYSFLKEKEAFSEVLTTSPEGSTNWESFIEKREKLLNWFVENILEILFRRESSKRVSAFVISPLIFSTINSIYFLYTKGKISKEDLKTIFSLIEEITGEIKNKEKIIEIFEELKNKNIDVINESILIETFLSTLVEKLFSKIKKIINRLETSFLKERNLIEEFRKTNTFYLKTLYEIYKKKYERGIVKGAIMYEDIAMAIVCKDVEFGAIDENYPSFLNNETCRFLIERLLEIKPNREEKIIEKHVRNTFEKLGIKGGKEFVDIENLEINLTPQLNVLASIVYTVSHFIAGINNFPEILEETSRRISNLNEEERNIILNFVNLNAFQKMKKIIEELREIKVDREEAFFIALETPESSPPYEGLRRICRLKDIFITTEALNLEFRKRTNLDERCFAVCVDTEHLLSNAFNLENEINELISYVDKYSRENKIYSRIAIYHIGIPKPYHGTVHLPFEIGSEEQALIYEYCFKMKKAGFSNERKNNRERMSYLIFERGGGSLPYQFLKTVILALRMIKKYLELNLSLNEILSKEEYYFDFFGLNEQIIREREAILKHVAEPLRGLIVWPEETHTIFGREVIEKHRRSPEEWAREELE